MKDSKEYQKLVRDRIPEIISKDGGKPVTRHLIGLELMHSLRAKLVEEAQELAAIEREPRVRSRIIEELVDVKEVYDTLLRVYHLSPQEIARAQDKKRKARGGFAKGIFLERVLST